MSTCYKYSDQWPSDSGFGPIAKLGRCFTLFEANVLFRQRSRAKQSLKNVLLLLLLLLLVVVVVVVVVVV